MTIKASEELEQIRAGLTLIHPELDTEEIEAEALKIRSAKMAAARKVSKKEKKEKEERKERDDELAAETEEKRLLEIYIEANLEEIEKFTITDFVDELQKKIVGETDNIMLSILSLMSLNDNIEKLIFKQTVGSSGSGKSSLDGIIQDSCLADCLTYRFDEFSPTSVFYWGEEHTMYHKLLVFDDVDESDIKILKSLGSNNVTPPSRLVTVNGVARKQQLDFAPLVWFSKVSTLMDEDSQLASRYFTTNICEDEEHHKVIDMVITSRKKKNINKKLLKAVIYHRLNKDITPRYDDSFDFKQLDDLPKSGHRDTGMLVSMLDSYVLLHNRDVITQNDFIAVKDIWNRLAVYNEFKLSATENKILNVFDIEYNLGLDKEMIMDETNLKSTTVYNNLKFLTTKGLLQYYKEGNKYFYALPGNIDLPITSDSNFAINVQ